LHRKTSSELTGGEPGRKAGFILGDAVCMCGVCGRNRGHFPAEETPVCVLTGETGQKSWLKRVNRN